MLISQALSTKFRHIGGQIKELSICCGALQPDIADLGNDADEGKAV